MKFEPEEVKISENTPLEYQSQSGRFNILGFWIFLGAEVALFSTLFGTYFVLINRTASAVQPQELIDLGLVLMMTLVLLTCSFTCGLAVHEMRLNQKKRMIGWLAVTITLGAVFLGLEIYEFVHYVSEGATLSASAYWSSFFLLLGTHGLHVAIGIIWFIFIIIQVVMRDLNTISASKVFIGSLYWHFLDVVWIFIFTGVYLLRLVI
ncbi:cytochrome aa3 quinol oxidase subunit III [Geomicrobium sediminis]|uniref:Quinol oxidase subunit 3 n=1 Tax=Geomicrobium sediminis TaxID=1347788 RepID=A0ABS2PEZ5_9BACL|nr:cytochrome aa3 quinol oxidase subunit III [Geomicrobium sediminis]MBM7633983.1 cytochrome aa3-600 menaquinol oxidase subunit 3 [Geomicrobium sediminis]